MSCAASQLASGTARPRARDDHPSARLRPGSTRWIPMLPTFFPDVAASLAAWPFLPAGKGALILILGGLAVLPLSLLWSRGSSGTQWATGVEQATARLGLGPSRIIAADARRCRVSLDACPSCRQKGRHGPCERERLALQGAVLLRAPHATVVELTCKGAGQRACSFEILRGHTP